MEQKPKAFCDSTLFKKLNNGDYDSVLAELQRWTKAGGRRFQGLANR
ncbi:glycoside hydrolase family protein [Bartonella quintana]